MSSHPDELGRISKEDAIALLERKRAEYEATEEFDVMRQEGAARIAIAGLLRAARMSKRGACAGAATFINEYGAGIPEVKWHAEDSIRTDAKHWSQCANQNELEAYTVAAITALMDSPLLDKQLRKLAAASYGRMSPETKAKFLEWAEKQ